MSNLRLVADQRRPGAVGEPPETAVAGPEGPVDPEGTADPDDARAPRPTGSKRRPVTPWR